MVDEVEPKRCAACKIVCPPGELEHAAAILHPKLGAPLRAAVEKGAALVPSAKKRGGMGTAIDVPLGHKDAAFVRSHFDAMEARVSDAPRAQEIVVAVVVTDSGRPLPRRRPRPAPRGSLLPATLCKPGCRSNQIHRPGQSQWGQLQ